ncbi:alcohol dehydrogenase catalytic domain-containing protein [Streptomyces nondiastaticus]
MSEGDKVAVDPSLFCGACHYCAIGRGDLCERWGAIGDTVDGAMAEYVKVPAANCHPLPGNVSLTQGTLVEPLSCAVHGFDKLPRDLGAHYLIYGAGTMGLHGRHPGHRGRAHPRTARRYVPAVRRRALHGDRAHLAVPRLQRRDRHRRIHGRRVQLRPGRGTHGQGRHRRRHHDHAQLRAGSVPGGPANLPPRHGPKRPRPGRSWRRAPRGGRRRRRGWRSSSPSARPCGRWRPASPCRPRPARPWPTARRRPAAWRPATRSAGPCPPT